MSARRIKQLAGWAGLALLTSTSGLAQVDYGHERPVTHAPVEFAPDFPALVDSEWGFPLGGFGGIRAGEPANHAPIIFVHGNNTDACDWKLVRDDFREAGWSDQALWALSYNGLGNDGGNYTYRPDQRCRDEHAERNGGDSVARITANDINVPDLYAFIRAVQDYTGSSRFSIVGHSLGVTVARKTLKVYPELRENLVAFVGIAGGNHGTTLCPPGSEQLLFSCDELTPGSDWLADLNGPDGADETYAPAAWLTIYDGSGTTDAAYAPPDEQSPRLQGADNREFPGTSHNGLRVEPAIVAEYRQFLEEAGMGGNSTGQRGGGGGMASWLLLALAGWKLFARAISTANPGIFVTTPRSQGRLLAAASLVVAGAALAEPPAPAVAEFPADFRPPMDAEYGFPLGGFGGQAGSTPSHVPVIFVHGNISDACGWKLVRDDFRAAGWNDQALWALSYNGVGSGRSAAPSRPDPRCQEDHAAFDGTPRITSNDVNVPDLHAFILAVREYTGSEKFSLVAHSLGVTLARRTLQRHPELRDDLVALVGIAGGNDGTSLCPPGTEKLFPGCAEMAATGSDWLRELNGPGGDDETYAPARWMTIYDGSGQADIAYVGPLADSPALKGAQNRSFPGTSHNDLRVREDIVAVYREFLEAASAADRRRQRWQRYLLGR